DELLGTIGVLHDRPCGGGDLVGQIPVGREVEKHQVRAILEHRRTHLWKVLPQGDFPAGEVDPEEPVRLREEAPDLVERELVARLHLPDVAGLALVVAPERDAEGEFEREIEAAHVGLGGAARERVVWAQTSHRALLRPDPTIARVPWVLATRAGPGAGARRYAGGRRRPRGRRTTGTHPP